MKKLQQFIENTIFQNVILGIIAFNALIMGLQTSAYLNEHIGGLLSVLDTICLVIFIIELLLKLVVYRQHFFSDGWNWFDLIIIIMSVASGCAFLSVFRIFRIFRVFRSLKALKGLRAMRMVSGLKKLRGIINAIGKSLPGMFWSAILLLLIYYIFGIVGTTLFGEAFPEWFGTLGKSIYTLFQVMTLESWSMGISRPVMEVFGWAWVYFVPFVLISSFIIMNVVCGIVVNSVSEVTAIDKKEEIVEDAEDKSENPDDPAQKKAVLKAELQSLREQLDKVEALLEQDEQ